MLLHHCDYSLLFYGARPLKAQLMRKYDTIPVPHVFQGEISQPMQVRTGELFSIGLSLIGSACYKLPVIIDSMEKMGQNGFKRQRFKASLNSVSLQTQHGIEEQLYANGLLFSSAREVVPVVPDMPLFICLQWCTPYRAKAVKNNQHLKTIDISKLMMAIIRRISLLQHFYMDTPLAADFLALKKRSQQLEAACFEQSIHPSQQRRYSAKHQRHLATSGSLGYFYFSLKGLEALWPYLFLGQFLNVGQNASMGFGRYKIMVLNKTV
jgi:hypothetical protein